MIQEFLDWLEHDEPAGWISFGNMSIYVKKEHSFVIGVNFIIYKKKYRRLGLFSLFIDEIVSRRIPFIVEDVINENIIPCLERKGFKKIERHDIWMDGSFMRA